MLLTNRPKPTLNPEALYGLPGEFVKAIDPYTEANPTAVLMNILISFGNSIGRGPYFKVEETLHFSNLYAVFVGPTSKARKGQSWSTPKRIFKELDPSWVEERVTSGLSSGEGLIFNIRDSVVDDYSGQIEPGISDKRLMVIEEEFSQPLKAMKREGNILSPVIRDAWDGNDLHPLTKTNPIRASNPHISIIGHITEHELLRHLGETEMANGFANRFIWDYVERSKFIPSPSV